MCPSWWQNTHTLLTMKLTAQKLQELIEEALDERRKWNKDNGRDYSKEHNPSGSPEQEDRNTRKRHQREYIKKHGKCPEGEELHHPEGLESTKVVCEPISTNRGRKEKSRLKKSDNVIKIKK